ncbi:nuclease-related domain-containing protein [Actinomyces gaoshouyii]|uniref:nuclease-related domain-containing protein n=1 Tax=Actinomyces gaoshouyii TaxID=1960083 RepID=UPI0009C17792|nr:nuclease-related domain-containing protein [Actinomyces gaoshouyii]ARD42511.1 hypothetical protein B6G06_09290 [Actinomyces gaoshouyii]
MSGAVYGRAGENLSSFSGDAGRGGQERGRRAEGDTAELLDAWAERGLTVFHSVRVRGGAADIDHVLVGARGVVLVDTKAWKPGVYLTVGSRTYRWVHGRALPERFPPGESTSLERSARQMRQAGIPVVGAVVAVWSTGSDRAVLGLARYPGARRITAAHRAVRVAGRLAGGGAADPTLVAQVTEWVRANEGTRT